MPTAFLFPGQGSQRVGMGTSLARYPAAAAVFAEVDDALGRPLSRLMADGPEAELTLTRNAQPALLAVSIAAVRALQAELDRPLSEVCDLVAGHSLGEYTALTAAGAFDVATAAQLLELRGDAMQAAVPVGAGGMAALIGLGVEHVAAIVAGVDGVVDIANDNADGQVVVSGERVAVDTAVAAARDAGARKVTVLPVSAPFHCRLMRPAAERMAAALAEVTIAPPAMPVVANVTAEPLTDVAAVRAALIDQVCGRVRWRETMVALGGEGVDRVVEAGAGRVLAGLAKRAVRGATVMNLETADDVVAVAAALAG
ncbi:MAG: ACP S-malonyltransferase [Alphaproteobacteria bacterium]|nr:ACP S-malonyltransferase [Alphaproteobacteria bacterium]